MSFRRHKMSYHGSKKSFSHSAGFRHVHPRNNFGGGSGPGPMRGGIRL
jgi:hypothetical protein